MRGPTVILRLLPLLALLASQAFPAAVVAAGERASSSIGEVSIPSPAKPGNAVSCVEPVDVMRRDHMKFLDHQRDDTVIDGQRGGRYSLVGCIDCHNPGDAAEAPRYEDQRHFCAECHAYTGVKIDCFECHADRGAASGQGYLDNHAPAWQAGKHLTAATLGRRLGSIDGD